MASDDDCNDDDDDDDVDDVDDACGGDDEIGITVWSAVSRLV